MPHSKKPLGKRFRHWLLESWILYATVWCFIRTLNLLPLSFARAIGRCGGTLAFHLDRGHRRVCLSNLALAFPEKSPDEHMKILRACYRHLGICAAEFCRFLKLTPDDLRANWVTFENQTAELLRSVRAEGKGLLFAAGHIGFWEFSAFASVLYDFPLISISRRIASDRIENMVNGIRSRMGSVIVNQEGALKAIVRGLKEEKVIGIIMDQYAGHDAPWIPFFGTPASTVDSVARLHLKNKTPIVSGMMIRRPDGKYSFRCRKVEVKQLPENEADAVHAILLECHKHFEEGIREVPEQWLWMHKRWKKPKA